MTRVLLMLLPLLLCGAASFDGSSQGASTTGTLSYGTNVVTFSYWVRFTLTTSGRVIFENRNNFNTGSLNFAAFYNDAATGQEAWSSKGVSTYRVERAASGSTATNQWVHRVVVYDASTSSHDIKAYGDGAALSLTVASSANLAGNWSGNRFYLGARGESSLRFQGEIQDLAVYAGEVSSDEAYSLGAQRMSPLKVRSAKLLYYWPFSAGENASNSPDLVGGIPVDSGTKSITTEQAPTFRK